MPPSARLVRSRPLWDRVKDYLNPGDFLLYVSEEVETRDWESKQFVLPIACGLHFVFLIARANVTASSDDYDDVFADDYSGSGWLTYIVSTIIWLEEIEGIGN